MENITPTLVLLWDVKRSLEKGYSVSNGIKFFIARGLQHDFNFFVKKWYLQQQSQNEPLSTQHLKASRRHLLSLLDMGLNGHSILESLKLYESEVIIGCEDEIQNHLAKLPLLLMIPLMGLIFPSLMMLLIGPALKMLQL